MKKLAHEMMSEDILVVKKDLIVRDLITSLKTYDTKCAFITDNDGDFIGLFDESNILRFCLNEDFFDSSVAKYLTPISATLNKYQRVDIIESSFQNIFDQFLPVLDNKKPIGIVRLADLYKLWIANLNELNKNIISNCNKSLRAIIHDLKNPIDAIQSINEMILSKSISKSEYLDSNFPIIIDENCKTISHLICDLLDLNCIKSGEFEINKESINLRPLLESIINAFKPKAHAKNIVIDFKADAKAMLYADKRRLNQIFQNLLSNSIKYSSPNSQIKVFLKNTGQNIEISFIDYGQGIKDIEIHKVFDEFCKISSMPTANESSTGLGLSIVKKLVEAHQGSVWVESEPYKHTSFNIKLPVIPLEKTA